MVIHVHIHNTRVYTQKAHFPLGTRLVAYQLLTISLINRELQIMLILENRLVCVCVLAFQNFRFGG